ncbi:MAG: endonuclease/exonuclease/phosphatase family protein [Angustibacter sp.]
MPRALRRTPTTSAPTTSAPTASVGVVVTSAVTFVAVTLVAAAALPASTATVAAAGPITIEQVQGTAHVSPLAGTAVTDVTGIVTAVGANGFWMQDPAPDDDLATSAGVFVYTRTAPAVAVADAVSVAGTVGEFRPGGSSGTANLSTTQISSPTLAITGHDQPLPAAAVLGVDRTAPPQTIKQDGTGNVEDPAAPFRPDADAIDFYESLEGMRIGVRDAQVVGPTSSFGEIPVVPGNLTRTSAIRSIRGGVVYGDYDRPNAMRVQLDDALLPRGTMPSATVQDTLAGDTAGVLDYSFANYKLLVTAPPSVRFGGLQREVTRATRPGELAVATFNVENLSPITPATTIERLAAQVVTNLAAPDLIALEEIQDDNGPTNDTVVTVGRTITVLTEAIRAAGGPEYQARWIDPQDDADGGQPGGNIRQVLLYRTDRGLEFVDRPGGAATTPTEVVLGSAGPQLSLSPGRITPADAAWTDSRKPLAGEFRYRGKPLFVVANHFTSKGGDDPLFGRVQPPVRSSEIQRVAQAALVRGFVDDVLAADPAARVVVLGDVNDVEFSSTIDTLVGSGRTALVDLPRTLPPWQRYTYVFEGNSQVLDHILLSPGLAPRPRPGDVPAYTYDIVHTNSEFPDQDSDHDPQVVRLRLR